MEIRCHILLIFICCISTVLWLVEGRNTGLRLKRQSEPAEKRIICYYAFWAARRPGEFKFVPSDIDPNLCTHILYGYARVEPNQGIVAYDYEVDIKNKGWASMVELKSINPNAKIILSLGGLFEGSARFTKMAGDIKQREIFVKSASRTLKDNDFDGIDMSWLYPGFSEGSSNADKDNYVTVMKELREELGDDYVVSITVPALKQYIDSGFDVPQLLQYADFLNVLAYSYHDSTDATVNHHGPLYSLPNDPGNKDANVDTTMREYVSRGARPDQLNLVIPLYGVAFVLEDADKNEIGASTEDEGMGLEEPGALIYFELCQRIRKESWTVKRINTTAMGPYAYKDKQWVAYDDEDMVKNKARYALQKGLGGLGFWTVDQDDFRGRCSLDNFPLLRAGREVLLENGNTVESPKERPTPAVPESSQVSSLSGSVSDALSSSPSTTSERSTTFPASKPLRPSKPTTSLQSDAPRDKENVNPAEAWSSDNGDIFFKPGPAPEGHTIFRSSRDIVFSDFKIWIQNHYNSPQPLAKPFN